MKKLTLLFFIIILSATTLAAEITINLAKDTYLPGQTLQAEILLSENPLEPLKSSNIVLLDQNENEIRKGMILTEIKENYYYLYFNLPTNLENTTHKLQVKDLKYNINNILTEVQQTASFEIIVNESIPIITISPALIKLNTSNPKTYTITFLSFSTSEVIVQISNTKEFIYPIRSSIIVPPYDSINLKVKTDLSKLADDETANILLTYNSQGYSIPVFIYKPTETNQTIPEENKTEEIIIENPIIFLTTKGLIEKEISQEKRLKGDLQIKNNLDTYLHNISLDFTGNLQTIASLNTYSFESIPPNETKQITISINENKNATPSLYQGDLKLSTLEGYTTTLPFKITIETTTEEPIDEPDTEIDFEEPPEEPKDYYEIYNITDKPQEKRANIGFLILIILIIIIIFAAILIKKLAKPKPKEKEFESLIQKP